jgi:probable F420-dependent oxidoreductase
VKLGLFGINTDACGGGDPDLIVRVAVAAEAAGWESVWTGEHYVLPTEYVPPSPAPGDTPMLDPFLVLGIIASHTSTLLLGTGVTVVPLHQPLALAKRVASLDVLSRGRFLFGVGVGYLEPEFRALEAPFDRRGRRLMDQLAAMQAVWTDEAPSFQGQFLSFDGVRAEPRPLQRPTPPLHFGGYVPHSFRRAVQHGHGWYGFALDLPGIEHCLAGLRAAASEVERPGSLPPLEISVTPHPRLELDKATLDQLAELGVDRLILLPRWRRRIDGEELLRFVEESPGQLL